MGRVLANGIGLNVTELPQRAPEGRLGRRLRGGMGTPIVMIHGLAASQAFWYAAGAPFLTVLGPVLLYDLRGHGRSDAPPTGYGVGDMADDLRALMDDRGIARAHLVAHSFGGMIALAFATRHPGRVASLTLADVRVRPLQRRIVIPARKLPPPVEARLKAIGVDIADGGHDDGVGYLRAVARIEVEAGEEASELLSQIYRHPKLFRSRRNAEKWIALTEQVSLIADLDRGGGFTPDDVARLRQPMLVLVGGQSTTLPSAREVKRLLPHAILREVPDVGHFFPMTQPRLFLRPTLRFLRAVERGDPRAAGVGSGQGDAPEDAQPEDAQDGAA